MADVTDAELTGAREPIKEITFDAPGTAYLESPGISNQFVY